MAGSPASNMEHVEEFLYDFAVDGGAVGARALGDLPLNAVIIEAKGVVETAATSGGSATVTLGTTGSAAGMVASIAVAALTANSTHGGAAASNLPLTSSSSTRNVAMTIGTAALTAGKIRWIIRFYIPSSASLSE